MTSNNHPNPPATISKGKTAGAPAAPQRTIETVRDLRGGGDIIVSAATVLDVLTPDDFAVLRVEVAEKRKRGEVSFRCTRCGMPVAPTGSRDNATGDGRGAHFRHYPGSAADCAWHTGTHLRSVGALQFGGSQEGAEHKRLKLLLAQSLEADPDFSGVQVEQRVSHDANWRQPDVWARYKDQPVALELQLARPQLNTMVERAAFYRRAGIRLIWVTSPGNLFALSSQAFRDLYFQAGGRIFAIDEASCERSEDTGTFHLRELSLEPCVTAPYALFNRWRDRMVGPSVIFQPEDQRNREGRRRYGTVLAEKVQARAPGRVQAVKAAVARGENLTSTAATWDALRTLIGGRDLQRSFGDELPLVLRFLDRVERLTTAPPEGIDQAQAQIRAADLQLLRARTGRHWVPLVEHVARAFSCVDTALTPEGKVLIGELKSQAGKLRPFHHFHRHMLCVLHPWLAFWLLAKPPAGRPPIQHLP